MEKNKQKVDYLNILMLLNKIKFEYKINVERETFYTEEGKEVYWSKKFIKLDQKNNLYLENKDFFGLPFKTFIFKILSFELNFKTKETFIKGNLILNGNYLQSIKLKIDKLDTEIFKIEKRAH